MGIDVNLKDGHGTGNAAKVNGEGEVSVVVHPHPPKNEEKAALPFRQYFTLDGTPTGDSDMRVDGSVNNVEFCIPADLTEDLYIKSITVVIADASAVLNKFGNLAALSTGVEFKWTSLVEGEVIIADSLKSNFEFVRLGGGNPSVGDGTGAFRASNVAGGSEGYIININFSEIFGLQYGVRLLAGSTDKLVFTIKDNVSGIDAFDAIGYGIRW